MSPKSTGGYRLGLVNPLTLVGKEIQSILRQRGIPYQELALASTVEEQEGALTEVDEEAAVVQPASDLSLAGLDLVFFAGPAEANAAWIAKRRELEFIAIDLSTPGPAAEGRLAVAGVNEDSIAEDTDLIVSPHPIATPLILLLERVQRAVPIEMCVATAIQPASEFGQSGIEELVQQTVSLLNAKGVPKEIFGRQLAFNLYPADEAARDRTTIVSQVRAVVPGDFPISVALLQGTLFHGHSISLFVRTSGNASAEELQDILSESDSIRIAEADETFSTVDAAGEDTILVDPIRSDPGVEGGFWFWVVSDNLRRSTGLNAVLLAEEVLSRFHPIVQ